MRRPKWPSLARRIFELALLGCLVALLAAAVLGRLIPVTGRTTLIVTGPSMEPAVPMGAVEVAQPVNVADLRIGDVVAVRTGPRQAIFTHRIESVVVRDGQVWLQTKGDANATPEPVLVPATAVVGRVSVVVPGLGYLLALLSTVTGVIAVSATFGALVVARSLVATFETEPALSRPGPALVG